MALTNAQAAQFQYAYETLEDLEVKIRPQDPDAADALKRARKELILFTRANGFNHYALSAQTATGITAAASLPRRGKLGN